MPLANFLVQLHPEGLALMHRDLRPEKDAGNHRQGTNKGRHLNKGKHDPPEYSGKTMVTVAPAKKKKADTL